MSRKKRVVVTGMGVVSCLGHDVDQFYDKLLAGTSGIKPITEFPCADFSTRFAGTISDFDPELYLDKKQARRVDKFIAYGVAAGKKALAHSKIDLAKLNKSRCGVLLGSGMGGMQVFADGVQTLAEKGHKRITPFFVPYIITNMAGALIAIEHGFMGPNYSVSTACATSNYAIISAANHIRNGEADFMLCGGTEAPIIPMGLAGFCAVKALSTRNEAPEKASRPWDRNRDGFVMAEGAGALILESLEHAQARGAPIFAEYLGGGLSCDAHHITEPHPEGTGITLCIRNALQDAQIDAKEVNYVNAHATSTPLGDLSEINALKQVFIEGRERIAVNATKSMIGHSLGAAGALEAIASIKSLLESTIHPTINLETPEPDLGFYFPTKAEKWPVKVALSNSFGFGGHNASILLAPYKPV